jgi:uncharacterized protein (DUF1015 family)
MPRFEPFRGLRYASDRVRLDDVVAPPYDVISPDDRAALEQRSPHNVVRIELPQDEDGRDRYEVAARYLAEWREDGSLRRDAAPALYGYGMFFADEAGQARHTIGVIGALELQPPGVAGILPHEQTMPKPKGDRLDLLRACRANTSPIWGLSPAPGLAELASRPAVPDAACTDTDGVRHELWTITEPEALSALSAAVASGPVVIADGHHRFETALAYQSERRQENGGAPGPYDLVMALIVELSADQLTVRPIHRLLAGLPERFDLVTHLAEWFEIGPTAPPDPTIGDRMGASGALALVSPAGTWLLRPRSSLVAAASHDLDTSRLDVALALLPPHELTYQHGWDLAASAVEKGEAQAAVLVRPATVDQIAATGHGGARMPPKTTFFWPKPRTGLVLREVTE